MLKVEREKYSDIGEQEEEETEEDGGKEEYERLSWCWMEGNWGWRRMKAASEELKRGESPSRRLEANRPNGMRNKRITMKTSEIKEIEWRDELTKEFHWKRITSVQ